ncbi:E3 SUMO-protein ligase SIZ1-like isoform X1 [Typha latifolia]|uniref:E3 SUMO-protein ligase SIZ1-like isoform X1 n=1 Tax=Typha latifolia TaxID=4733 RepID=UPI003C2EF3C9
MDLVSGCKDKLGYFRIKELKDVLHQVGVAKQGKKQDLVDRILALLSDEQVSKLNSSSRKEVIGKEAVAKIIDDTYRKMQVPGAPDLASKSQSALVANVKPKKEVDDSSRLDMKIRCPCGSSLSNESMIKCEDPRCNVWQHLGCVIIPEKPIEGVPLEIPPCFYCEICRINRADPFWLTVAHPLLPVKLASSAIAADGTCDVQCIEKSFPLSRAHREMLQRTDFDLQIWCILLNDKVPFRIHWPLNADLQVNGIPIRMTNRPSTQQLGNSGRDDGPVITTCSREGVNKICLSRGDARTFCFGVRIAKRRTVHQVLNLVPKEADGESFGDALTRVRRCLGGGTATDNADSDSDIEVVADSVTINLRCPMSGSRMRTAGRFKPCVHMGCFDLETFVELNQRSRKWQCPICLKNYSLESIIIDPYFNCITSLMQNCGEDANEIDVKPDGSWRVKNGGEYEELAQWHLPDGTLYVATDAELRTDLDVRKHIKEEGFSEGFSCLKLGSNRNNRMWEASKPEELQSLPFGNDAVENFESKSVIPMNSSRATGRFKNGEDPSYNQQGRGCFAFSLDNDHELGSPPLNFDPYNVDERVPEAPSNDADVIILSDSDEDNVTVVSPRVDYAGTGLDAGISFPANQPESSGTYIEDPGEGMNGNSCLDLLNNDTDDFGMPFWDYQTCPQNDASFHIFEQDSHVVDDLLEVQQHSTSCQLLNGYGSVSGANLGETGSTRDFSSSHSNFEAKGSLLDNPLGFAHDDSSLQIFLSNEPDGGTMHANSNGHVKMATGSHSDNWISLSLGHAGGSYVDRVATEGLSPDGRFTADDNRTKSLVNAASILQSMNDDRLGKAAPRTQRSSDPFSPPRQPRSVRQRLVLSIDTDSD